MFLIWECIFRIKIIYVLVSQKREREKRAFSSLFISELWNSTRGSDLAKKADLPYPTASLFVFYSQRFWSKGQGYEILSWGVGLVKSYPTHAPPWTVACQAPLSLGFSRQECWSAVAISFSRGSSELRDQTCISYDSCIGRRILSHRGSPSSRVV